jgi:hypothetical protein
MKGAKMKDKPTCVQCHQKMEYQYGNESISFPFCNNPACPNFSLLAAEILPSEKETLNKISEVTSATCLECGCWYGHGAHYQGCSQLKELNEKKTIHTNRD